MVRVQRPLTRCLYLGLAFATLALPSVGHSAEPEPLQGQPQKVKVSVKQAFGLAFDTTIKNSAITGKTVRVWSNEGTTYLSLSDLSSLFDFALTVGADRADGFFLAPENSFSLSLSDGRLLVRGVAIPLNKQDAANNGGALYISTTAFLSWFDIGTMIEREKNTLHFSTPNVLPREARGQRERKRLGLAPLSPVDGAGEISGHTTAGYEVELYKDKKLFAFQFAGTDGSYRFTNVPVPAGEEQLRVVLYGPQGQHEERIERPQTKLPAAATPDAPTAPAQTQPQPTTPTTTTRSVAAPQVQLQAGQAAMGVTSAQSKTMVIQPKNWRELSVFRGEELAGTIEAYAGARGVLLRLDAFLRAIGADYAQQTTADQIDITLASDHHVMIDMAQRRYIDQGQHYSLSDTDGFKNDHKIYLHESLLHRLFDHVPFIVDLAHTKLKLSTQEKKPETTKRVETAPPANLSNARLPSEKTAEKTDIAPTPAPAPVTPVIIDDTNGMKAAQPAQTSPESFEAHDVLHIEQNSMMKSVSSKDNEKDEPDDKSGEPLILQPRLKKLGASNEFIEAIDATDLVFVPLGDLLHILDFPAKVDGDKASGYLFTPENDFALDAAHKEILIGGKRFDVTLRDIRRRGGVLYISTDAMSAWFGLASEIDRSRGTIHITTDRLLPQEEQELRQKRWSQLLKETERTDKDYPVLQNSYTPFGFPTIDVNMSSGFAHNNEATTGKKNSFDGGFNVQGSSEIGYLTSQFYAQGSTTSKALDTVRLQAGRKDPNGGLLSGMGATEFAVGDITSPSLTFVTANAAGRGGMVTNRTVISAQNFDVRTFTGDSVPGYEVELYRNNVLLSFQTVDASGRYNFKDIPILYGENTFRLVFYGPQGQREERVETVSAASALLKENQFEYTLGAMQRGFSLLPLNEKEAINENVPNGNQIVGAMRYGVTSNYTIGAAVAQTRLGDGDHRYVTTSSGANLFGILSETSFAKDMAGDGWASGVSALTGLDDVSLRARYRSFHNFMSETINSAEAPRTSEASAEANAQMYLPLIQEFALGLSAVRETFESNNLVPRYTYGTRFSKSLWGLSFTNEATYIRDQENRINNSFGVQTRLWDINFRATGLYELKPERQFQTASVMADYRLTDKLSAQTQVDRDLPTARTSFNQNIIWDFDAFRLGLNNRVDTEGDYSLGMNVLFSLGHNDLESRWHVQPQQASGGGAVAGRVFIDDNANGKFDDGETLVSSASVRVNRSAVKLDENGYFASAVTPYETSRVELSVGELSDPLLTPATKGYQVITRPGDTIVADFPLVHTTIVDGNTYILNENGERREAGNIVVELQNKDGTPVRRVMSEGDGYFSIDKVPAGDYWLAVPEEVLSSMNVTLKEKIHLPLAEVKEFITGRELVLVQKEKLNGPPLFETQMPALPPAAPSSPPPTPPTLPENAREEKVVPKDEDKDKDKDKDALPKGDEQHPNENQGEVTLQPVLLAG